MAVAGMVSELVYVVGPDHHPRLVDLADALAEETAELGLTATVERTALPPRRAGRVAVLLDPGQLRVGRRRRPLGRRALVGSVLIHAGLARHGRDGWRRGSQPAFELDLESAGARRSRGEAVTHLPVGWVPRWAAPVGKEREVDLAIIGANTDEQLRMLAAAADELARWRVHIVGGTDWLTPGGPAQMTAAERCDLLARTKVLIDLDRPRPPRLDALRAAEAACAGAVLVRETRRALDPLEEGREYVAGGRGVVGVAVELLEDPERRLELQSAALAAVEAVPLRSAAEAIVTAAASLPETDSGRRPAFAQRRAPAAAPPPVTTDPESAAARRRLKRVRLAQIELARELDLLALRLDGTPEDPVVELESESFADAEPRVSVLVTLFNYEREIATALSSAAASEFDSFELVVVDDASRDSSRARVREWIQAFPDVPARLIAHPANRGLPRARNTAFAHARGELAFILDADNSVLPHGLGRLVEALEADPGAAFAYGIAARVDDRGRPIGLINIGGWDPSRLRLLNYIDAMAMTRTEAVRELGGYTTEIELYGWEDYDLWCRMAERGMRAAYVPEILATYRSAYSGMAWSVSNISTTDAYRTLIARAPKLMSGVRPPR